MDPGLWGFRASSAQRPSPRDADRWIKAVSVRITERLNTCRTVGHGRAFTAPDKIHRFPVRGNMTPGAANAIGFIVVQFLAGISGGPEDVRD